MMVNEESSLEGKKGNVCWQLGRGEGGRFFPAAPEPLPWLGSHWQSCLQPWLAVTVCCHSQVCCAHTDVTVRLSVAIGAAQHFLHCPDFSLFIVRAAHPSCLPSCLPLALAGFIPHLMVKVPLGNAIPPVPMGCVPGGSWAAPLSQTWLFPISFTFSKANRSLSVPSQAVVVRGREALAALSAGAGGWLDFRAGFSCLGTAGGTSWLLWQDVGWAGLYFSPLSSPFPHPQVKEADC